jgi:hypothetical protein
MSGSIFNTTSVTRASKSLSTRFLTNLIGFPSNSQIVLTAANAPPTKMMILHKGYSQSISNPPPCFIVLLPYISGFILGHVKLSDTMVSFLPLHRFSIEFAPKIFHQRAGANW